MITVIRTARGWGEFDFAQGFRPAGQPGRNLDEIAAVLRARLEDLSGQKRALKGEFAELRIRKGILARAIAEAKDDLETIETLAHPFREEQE